MMQALLAAVRAVSAVEVISAVLGLAYLLLAMRRNRWCWVAGGVSSAMLAYLSLRAQLPMQAALQIYYVAMSVYGYWYWSRTSAQSGQAITVWPVSRHLLACAAVVAASILSARWLARETQAAWPYLDSLTTWGSLLATWLVARVKLENWLYWVLIDAALVLLFAAQALYLFALLNALYVVIAFAGFLSWQKSYRTVRAQAVS
jgi:nicotinamide mononucleotide transporter